MKIQDCPLIIDTNVLSNLKNSTALDKFLFYQSKKQFSEETFIGSTQILEASGLRYKIVNYSNKKLQYTNSHEWLSNAFNTLKTHYKSEFDKNYKNIQSEIKLKSERSTNNIVNKTIFVGMVEKCKNQVTLVDELSTRLAFNDLFIVLPKNSKSENLSLLVSEFFELIYKNISTDLLNLSIYMVQNAETNGRNRLGYEHQNNPYKNFTQKHLAALNINESWDKIKCKLRDDLLDSELIEHAVFGFPVNLNKRKAHILTKDPIDVFIGRVKIVYFTYRSLKPIFKSVIKSNNIDRKIPRIHPGYVTFYGDAGVMNTVNINNIISELDKLFTS